MKPPAKRVVLHIGLPKTGTTSIQSLLNENRDLLSSKFGTRVFLNSDTLKIRRIVTEISDAGPSFRRNFRLRKVVNRWQKAVAAVEEETIILSNEMILGFHSGTMFGKRMQDGPAVAIRALRQIFHGHDLHWIIYDRNRAAQQKSAYNQSVKVRQVTASFDDWQLDNCPPGVLDQLLSDLKAELGSQLTFVDYDAERRSGRLWGQPVLEQAGLSGEDIAQLEVPPPKNESIPPGLLDLKRRLNAVGFSEKQSRKAMAVLAEAYSTTPEGYGDGSRTDTE